ncbi:hypothetical protein [Streptomyces sp. NPDC048142]|uniref:hypothetical protein n=1 Tax=Streptomyces sp. NPDC048142 TaxID=3365501 RepID=UPI003717C886
MSVTPVRARVSASGRPRLRRPAEGPPTAGLLPAEEDPRIRLVAALARDAVGHLSGPQREELRACHPPRPALRPHWPKRIASKWPTAGSIRSPRFESGAHDCP